MKLGTLVRDRITGFEGRATGYCSYITGCNQVLVQPRVAESGEWRDASWFDEQRLDQVDDSVIEIDNTQGAGADLAPPVR